MIFYAFATEQYQGESKISFINKARARSIEFFVQIFYADKNFELAKSFAIAGMRKR